MRTKVTLVLLFLNVALFFFIFYVRQQWVTEERLQETRRRVLGPETGNIQSLEIAGGGSTIALEKRGEAWWLTQPFAWPANLSAVSTILTTLQTLQHETSFAVADLAKNGASLATYGLEKPPITVSFTVSVPGAGSSRPSPRIALRIGDTTKDGNRLYVLSPDGARVHVVDRLLANDLLRPLEQLRSDALFTIPVFEVGSFKLQAAAPARPIRIKRDGNRWSFDTPIIARASKAVTETTINLLNGLRVRSFVPAPPPELNPATNRALSLTLEGNNRSETLVLGGPVRPPAPAAGPTTAPDVEYYGKMEDKAAFFTVTVSADLMEKLRDAQTKLRETRILDFDASAVTAIALRAPNAPELQLQRLEATAATGDGAPWQIVRRDGNQAPATQPADLAAVQRLLEKLSQLSAQKFLSDYPTNAELETWGFNSPQREIALTMSASATPGTTPLAPANAPLTATLKIGVGADRGPQAYALDSAHSVYQIDAEILLDLPLDARAWRDRRLRDLPAGEQITALKLTDAATKAVIFEKTFAGAPAAATPDPELAKLLAQLRTLRAKAFLADHFTPTVRVAGAEQPWKYQLDVTVALGGGTVTQTKTYTLFFSDRLGGNTQLAGASDLDAVFEIEQPLLDALAKLTYGPHDPGPPPATPAATTTPAATPPATPPAPKGGG
jgi:hypothetical protein